MLKIDLVRGVTAAAAALAMVCLLGAAQPASQPESKPEKKPDMAYVHMKTTHGPIVLELNRKAAPVTVENFLQYTHAKFYDGLVFHRVIPTFMIQGGGFDSTMNRRKADAMIAIESDNGLSNRRGTIAMARTSDPNSATSQFFINVKDNIQLDYMGPRQPGYAVFGKVVAGMDAVDAIKDVDTHRVGQHQNVPVEPVVIESVREVTKDEADKLVAASKKDA